MSAMFVRGTMIDPTSAEITLNNIIENEFLFRMGFLGDLIMVLSDVTISILFYFLLKDVHKGLAILATVFRLIQSAILGVNLINLFKPVLLIQGAEQLSPDQMSELSRNVMNQMQIFEYGYLISGVFFAVNCLIMGKLLCKSVYFPKFLGLMLFFAGVGYLFNCMANFVAPSLIDVSTIVMFFTAVISELTFCIYLLTKGIKSQKKMRAVIA